MQGQWEEGKKKTNRDPNGLSRSISWSTESNAMKYFSVNISIEGIEKKKMFPTKW